MYLGTAHSTKGLEFDTVRLADDFQESQRHFGAAAERSSGIMRRGGNGSQEKVLIRRAGFAARCSPRWRTISRREEINLLYVALTRAKQEIEIPEKYLVAEEYVVDVSSENCKSRAAGAVPEGSNYFERRHLGQ